MYFVKSCSSNICNDETKFFSETINFEKYLSAISISKISSFQAFHFGDKT